MIDRARQDYEASGRAPEIAATLGGTLAQYALETRDPQALAELRRLVDEARVSGANLRYAIGLLSATAGDLARTRQEITALNDRTATARIMRAELEAVVAAAEGDKARAITLLATASAQDLAQVYTHFGPPSPYKPPHELHGEMLLAAGRPADALKAFQEGMRIYRRRTDLLLGATRAAAAAKQAQAAGRYATELREIWRDADRGLAALDEIRRTTQQ
jgi:tetratricopeptide (TPR) repeat protein